MCIRSGDKFIWGKPTPDPIFVWIPRDNLVAAAIQRRILNLRLPDKTSNPSVAIEYEGNVPKDARDSLRLQIQYITQAFPEPFKEIQNKFFVYQTIDWAKNKAAENKCPIPSVLNDPPPTMHSEGVQCNFASPMRSYGSFLNWASFKQYDRATIRRVGGMDEWANQAAQEGGGASIQSFYNRSWSIGNGNPLPAWYEQGGQDVLTSIAFATQTRKWRQASLSQGQPNTCGGMEIARVEFYGPEGQGCEYTVGAMASELLVALFGFDAPIAWYKVIDLGPGKTKGEIASAWRKSFKEVYGLELTQFYAWVNAYRHHIGTYGGKKLPADLVTKLKSIQS